jgi:hypothetical protein
MPGEEGAKKEQPKLSDNLAVALILFPGFLTLRVSEYLAYSPKLDGVELVASALAATLLNLGIALVVVRVRAWKSRARIEPIATLVTQPWFVVILAAISILTGIVWAVTDSNRWLFSPHLTERVSRAEVWDTAFQLNSHAPCKYNNPDDAAQKKLPKECPKFVRVVTESGEVYHGSPMLYSEGGEERTLLIDKARREVLIEPRAGTSIVIGLERVECLAVGTDNRDGRVLVPKDQIRLVEFRGIDLTGNADHEYVCDPKAPHPKAVERNRATAELRDAKKLK